MKHVLLSIVVLLATAALARAECYADYKAKQDDPLRLHYGVMQIPDSACSVGAAGRVVAGRLGEGWQLLNVVSVFGPEGLDQRRASAGVYFLRY